MPQQPWIERLVRYQYLEPLLAGQRVLEVGCGTGRGAEHVAGFAREVLGIDDSTLAVAQARHANAHANLRFAVGEPDRLDAPSHAFDIVLVPELQRWITRGAFVPELQRVLAPGGLVVLSTPSADADEDAEGMAYQDLTEYLAEAFSHVRLFGEIPFAGTIMADFTPDDDLEPALECSLIEEDEPPHTYLALCSDRPVPAIGYTVVQLPTPQIEHLLGASRLEEERDRLRQRLMHAEARADEWATKSASATTEALSRGRESEQLNEQISALQREIQQAGPAKSLEEYEQLLVENQALRDELASASQLEDELGDAADGEDLSELRRRLAEAEREVLAESNRARSEVTQARREARQQQEEAVRAKEELQAVQAALHEARRLLQRRGGGDEELLALQEELRLLKKEGAPPSERAAVATAGWRGNLEEQLDRESDRASSAGERAVQLTDELAEARRNLDVERERLRAAEGAVRELRQLARTHEGRAEAAEQRTGGLVARVEQAAAELSNLHQRIAELQGLHQADGWRIDELKGRLRASEARSEGALEGAIVVTNSDQRRQVEQLEAAKQNLERRLSRVEERRAELERRLSRCKAQRELEASTPCALGEGTSARELSLLRADLARSQARIGELESRCDQLLAELQRVSAAAAEGAEGASSSREVVWSGDGAPAADAALRGELEELRRRLEGAQRELKAAHSDLHQAREDVARLQAASRLSEEMESPEGEELLRVRQRQLDALMDGAALHHSEATQLQDRVAELEELVAELRRGHAALEAEIQASAARCASAEARAEGYQSQLSVRGRELALAQGELLKLRQGRVTT